jgi:hypothetical protein
MISLQKIRKSGTTYSNLNITGVKVYMMNEAANHQISFILKHPSHLASGSALLSLHRLGMISCCPHQPQICYLTYLDL